ncbi:hypothetical protein P4O66_020092, partial [Electrophorus voltai]
QEVLPEWLPRAIWKLPELREGRGRKVETFRYFHAPGYLRRTVFGRSHWQRTLSGATGVASVSFLKKGPRRRLHRGTPHFCTRWEQELTWLFGQSDDSALPRCLPRNGAEDSSQLGTSEPEPCVLHDASATDSHAVVCGSPYLNTWLLCFGFGKDLIEKTVGNLGANASSLNRELDNQSGIYERKSG